MDVRIQRVTTDMRHVFASILNEANAWQTARGSQGWSDPFDDSWMLPRIDRGELYLVYRMDRPVATFRILFEDRPFWGVREVGDSIYLHTFAVRRDVAGLGIGRAVIETVVGMARERGLARVRLDCFLENAGLVSYYERNGFASVGTTSMKGKTMNLMERDLGRLVAGPDQGRAVRVGPP